MRCSDLSMVVSVKLLLVSRQPEITQLHCPVVGNQHVLTLQITVKQLPFVKVEQGHGDLLGDFDDFGVV